MIRTFLTALLMGGVVANAQDDLLAEKSVRKLADGMKFVEGPTWTNAEGGYLIFSDIPADRLYRWSEKNGRGIFREPSHNSNGNTRDGEGRLITCEHGSRRVTRTEKDGAITVLAEAFEGKRLNSPNDVVVKSDGTICFTDPTYGINRKQQEQPGQFVFRLDPRTKELTAVAKDFEQPNGLCFSPDEKRLYIADSGSAHHVRAFDVTPENTLANGRIFCLIDKGVPDGMRCDERGNLWSSAGDGVQVFAPDGKLILKLPVPESPANLAFGGADRHTLFITAKTSLYAIRTQVRGR